MARNWTQVAVTFTGADVDLIVDALRALANGEPCDTRASVNRHAHAVALHDRIVTADYAADGIAV